MRILTPKSLRVENNAHPLSAQYAQIAQENLQRAFKNKASLFDAVV